MLKKFSHHYKYFYVFETKWNASHKEPYPYKDNRVLLCTDTDNSGKVFDYDTFHHSVETKNGWDNYTISKADNIKFRVWYNGAWHIPVPVLTKAIPDEEWQRQIDAYDPKQPKRRLVRS